MSGIINKVKEAIHSDKHNEVPEGTHGTHNSKVANAADPRIDSDRDHRANPATGTHSATTGVNDPEGTHGPHSSRVANTLDPRVDSDRDNRALGGNSHTTGTTHSSIPGAGHSSTGHTTGVTGSSNVTGYNDPTGTHGPHSSRVANAADPRVDSDRDHRGAPGTHTGTAHTGPGLTGPGLTGTGHTGTAHTGVSHAGNTHTGSSNVTGYNDPTGTHGPHSSRAANAADPRIDSDRDHRAAPGAAGTSHLGSGPGPAPNTAGPHSKDILNKVDPRVDSDLDGSKTIGGNKTLSSTGRDPTDAAQAPPSVLRQHIGDPSIEHGDHTHGRAERHASQSHQETHRGI